MLITGTVINGILKSAGHAEPSRKPRIQGTIYPNSVIGACHSNGKYRISVPAINWSFNADPTKVDRTLFQGLQAKSQYGSDKQDYRKRRKVRRTWTATPKSSCRKSWSPMTILSLFQKPRQKAWVSQSFWSGELHVILR